MHNRRLAKNRVEWLIEHFTSYQLLCRADMFSASKFASSPMQNVMGYLIVRIRDYSVIKPKI